MPRSVGTSAPSSSRRRPLSRNGAAFSGSTQRRRDALEDPQAEEDLLEVGVATARAAPRRRPGACRPRRATGTPRAGGRSTSVGRRGTSARRRRARGTGAAPSSRGCGRTRSRASPSSRPRSAGTRRRASTSHASSNMSACRSGSGGGTTPCCDLAAERRRGLDRERVRAHVLGREVDRLAQRALPRLERLAVGAVDQVEVHVRVPGRPRRRASRAGPRPGRGPARAPRAPRGSNDCAPIDRRANPASSSPSSFGAVDRVGVRLDRDLGVRRDARSRAADARGAPSGRRPRASSACRRRGTRSTTSSVGPRRRRELGLARAARSRTATRGGRAPRTR